MAPEIISSGPKSEVPSSVKVCHTIATYISTLRPRDSYDLLILLQVDVWSLGIVMLELFMVRYNDFSNIAYIHNTLTEIDSTTIVFNTNYIITQEMPIYPDLFLRNAIGTLFKRIILLTQNYQRK